MSHNLPQKSDNTRILVLTPWKRRWELGSTAGVSDDYNFVKKLTQRGFELHFVAPKHGRPIDVPFENYIIHTYPNFFDGMQRWPTAIKRILWPLFYNVLVTIKGALVARRIQPKFVLGHTHYSSLPAYILRELFHIPSAIKLFGVMDLVRTDWPKSKYWFKNFEQILALKIPQDAWIILDDGTNGKEAALRHGVPRERIQFLPNGINLDWMSRDLDPNGVRGEFGIEEDVAIVLWLARLVESKRPELFLRAIPRALAGVNRPVLFMIAGDGEMRAGCEALARELGVDSHVLFVGPVPHPHVPDVMSACEVFVSTGRMSNMAIPTCEAFVCGLPVIAFDVGDTGEVVRDGDTGRLVPDHDVQGLGDAIAEVISDDEKRRQMGERARAFARERFTDWDERTDMEIDIISGLINARGRGPLQAST